MPKFSRIPLPVWWSNPENRENLWVFPSSLYLGQIPDPENTLPDPVFFNPAPRDGQSWKGMKNAVIFTVAPQ